MKSKPRKTALLWAIPALVLISGECASRAHAQQVSNPDTTKIVDEPTVQLSPFTVTAAEDHGYVATSTLAGTRIKTDLRDIGSAISIVTEKFLKDTGATDNATLLQYTTNTEVGGSRGNYSGAKTPGVVNEKDFLIQPQSNTRIRGLAAADNTRDFFLSDIPWDSFNVDRVDIQRGPNAMLFGLGSPAGIINSTLRHAGYKNGGNVETRVGRFNSTRTSIDANVVLVPEELAIRVDAIYGDQKYQQKPAFSRNQRLYGAVRIDPKILATESNHTTIKVNAEFGETTSNNPRQVTPADNITPWYDPAQLNQHTVDSVASWATLSSLPPGSNGMITTPHGVVQATGERQPNNGTIRNPYMYQMGAPNGYQSGFDFLVGGTPLPNQDFNVPVLVGTYYNHGYAPAAVAPANGQFTIAGIPYNEMSSVAGYAAIASNLQLPNYIAGVYIDKSVSDSGIFDYYHKLIDGDNKREWQKWHAFSASLDQTFFHDRAGAQVAFDQQSYTNGQYAVFNNPGINVDINKYLADGSENPNLGRAYIQDSGKGGNSYYTSNRDNIRATAFGEIRAEDFMGHSLFASVLGRHRATGLASRDELSTDKRSFRLFAANVGFQPYTNNSSAYDLVNNGQRDVHVISYLGAPNSKTGLTSAGDVNVPTSGKVRVWVPAWTAASDVDPTAPWAGVTGINSGTQKDNPANYQGWTNKTVGFLNYLKGDENQLVTSALKQKSVVNSTAANLQSFWWDGTLVSTFGVRKDKIKYWDRTLGLKQPDAISSYGVNPDGTYNPNDSYYGFSMTPAGSDEGTTHSTSIVLHTPKAIAKKLPYGLDVSLFYNTSDNFQVSTSRREDIYGNALANAKGKTKDLGVVIAALDNRVIFKVNHFQSNVQGASIANDISNVGHLASIGYNFYRIYATNYNASLANATLDSPPVQGNGPWGAAWNFADGGNIGDNAALGANPGSTRGTLLQAEANMLGAWQSLIASPEYGKFVAKWFPRGQNADPVAVYQPWVGASLTTNGGNAAFTTTADVVSKGWEYELTVTPVTGWSVSANASSISAQESNVGGGETANFMNKVWTPFINGPGGHLPFWGNPSLNTGDTMRNDWFGNWGQSGGNWQRSQIGIGAAVAELSKFRLNLVTNYEFQSNGLKGFNIGGGFRHGSAPIIGYGVTADPVTGAPTYDKSKSYIGPTNNTVDFWAGYEHKLTRTTKWRIQLNVENVLAKKSLIPISTEPDGTPANFRLPEPLGWTLTNTISF